jgi:membrane protein DedA with SNARE-associated domain
VRVFAEAELASLMVWSISVLALGYFFSYTALSISRDIRKFIVIIFLFLLGFFILEKLIAFIIELSTTKDKNNTQN